MKFHRRSPYLVQMFFRNLTMLLKQIWSMQCEPGCQTLCRTGLTHNSTHIPNCSLCRRSSNGNHSLLKRICGRCIPTSNNLDATNMEETVIFEQLSFIPDFTASKRDAVFVILSFINVSWHWFEKKIGDTRYNRTYCRANNPCWSEYRHSCSTCSGEQDRCCWGRGSRGPGPLLGSCHHS